MHPTSPPPAAPPPPAVVCLGETMAVLTPSSAGPLHTSDALNLRTGGAESNVAASLAGLGHRSAWLGRVGDDPFGRRVLADLAARGVATDAVETDPDRPTGLYLKEPVDGATRPHYYRAGSAASALGPGLPAPELLATAAVVHVTGITAALSDSCRRLLHTLLVERAVPGPLLTFDVNHRAALWRGSREPAAEVLLTLARAADLVLVGRDEAAALWGTEHPDEIRALLAPAPRLVVKDADVGATSYTPDGDSVFVAAPRVDVVEPVGAGDAFAAGYLAGLLEERPEPARLRLGHLAARAALTTTDDVPRMPPRHDIDPLLAPDAPWSTAP
ncbi:sugar kinase [Streptomyces bohaiensis]|uniref:sugar kinase n=1 Tax=Streptomyces bohaiensis TaxID=1431344 RepID=UPI003B7BFB36